MMGRRQGQKIGPLYDLDKEKGCGAWLYKARIEARVTIDELAAKAHVSRRTIIRIESGIEARRRWRPRRTVENQLRRVLGLAVG